MCVCECSFLGGGVDVLRSMHILASHSRPSARICAAISGKKMRRGGGGVSPHFPHLCDIEDMSWHVAIAYDSSILGF